MTKFKDMEGVALKPIYELENWFSNQSRDLESEFVRERFNLHATFNGKSYFYVSLYSILIAAFVCYFFAIEVAIRVKIQL